MLKLDDLLAPLSAATASDLKASTKALKASGKAGPLSAPLPTRTQDRIDRVAAYEQTKQEVDKWKITMKQIKQVGLVSVSRYSDGSCLSFHSIGRASKLPATTCRQDRYIYSPARGQLYSHDRS